MFERSLVSGVTVAEIMLGHILTQFIVMAIQTAVLLIFALVVFNVYNVGPIIIIILFELLIGFTGMCLGFVISTGMCLKFLFESFVGSQVTKKHSFTILKVTREAANCLLPWLPLSRS